MIRSRSLNDREKREGAKRCLIVDDNNQKSLTLDARTEQRIFNFDYVGGEATTQEEIFKVAGRPLTHACLDGTL